MTRLRRGAAHVTAALALAAAVGGVTPAHAEVRTTPDAVGDPVRITYDFSDDEQEPPTETAPEAKRVDLVSTRYDYRGKVLVVRGTARAATRGVDVQTRVRSAGQDYRFSNGPRGGVQGFRISDRGIKEVPCTGGRTKIDAGAGTYQVTIPVGCFGAPDSVRLGFGLFQSRFEEDFQGTVEDDANRVGGTLGAFQQGPTLGLRLARGAQPRTIPDAVGDPVRTTYGVGADESEPTVQTAPEARKVDLISTRYDYRRTALVVRGTAHAAGRGVRAVLEVRAAGEEFVFVGLGGGKVSAFNPSGEDGEGLRCTGGRSRVDARRGTYELRIPATCFGSPRNARFGFGLARRETTRTSSSTTVDDANRDGYPDDDADLRLGPALARG